MSAPASLRDLATAILKDQNAHGNMIELMWRAFAKHIDVPAGGVQWTEMRRAFFAGAATMWQAQLLILDPGTEATEADFARMDSLNAELDRFMTDLMAGRG